MIAKVQQGSRTYGLLCYVYGPGRREEHQRPRLVASWDGVEFDPAAEHESRRGEALYTLARRLDRAVEAYGGRLENHVWHASVRSAPGDPELSDAQWAQIARRLVAAAGITPRGDPNGCRWIAVRHADDHVHLVATLVRQDGKLPDRHNDWLRLRKECRAIEHELDLRVTAEADRTAVQAPTLAEQAKAHRLRRQRVTSREILRGKVRPIALEATSEADFFTRLHHEPELLVHRHTSPSGQVVGYAVACEGDTGPSGEPIWFSGSKLAPDLSLPRIRQRWTDTTTPARGRTTPPPITRARAAGRAHQREDTAKAERIAAWQQATRSVQHATAALRRGDPGAAATVAGLADLMTVSARRAPEAVRDKLELAARHLERVGRDPWRERSEASRHMRFALQAVVRAGSMVGQGDEMAIVAAFVVAAVLAVRAVYALRQSQRRQTHAQLAWLAGAHLQYAAELLGARPRARPDHVAAQRPDLQSALRHAVRGRADAEHILRHTAWPSLAGMLARVERLGHNPAEVLAGVVWQRPLRHDTTSPARSDAQVLIWRLERWLVDHAPAAAEHTAAVRRTKRSPHAAASEASKPQDQPLTHDGRAEPTPVDAQNDVADGHVLRTSDDRLFQRAVLAAVQAQECSRALLERELWVRQDKADELLKRLSERGVIAQAAEGGARYTVTVPLQELATLKKFVATSTRQAVRQAARQSPSGAARPSPRRPPPTSSPEAPPSQAPRRR
ncbi:relaxase/mobilization nuclease domain-containing protein [Nonomuraea sp. NPDC049400]|uniref:relaxase/mobilization nuclease domain-containing protein n=1 Tax=Nonomuraea sp. NPDC049400 TaxID=3364352 RepID=UPI0037A12C8E